MLKLQKISKQFQSIFFSLINREKSATPQEKEHELKRNSEAKIYYEEIVENGHGQNDLCPERREWTFLLSSLLILQGLSMVVVSCKFVKSVRFDLTQISLFRV